MPPKYAVHLSAERLVEYSIAYAEMDTEGKGKIPADNVITCMRKCGLMPSMCEMEVCYFE